MKTLRFLLKAAGARAFLLAPLGLVSAALSTGFVAVIHQALAQDALRSLEGRRELVLAFVGFGFGRILAGYFSGTLIFNHVQEAITELRRKLIRHVLGVPYRNVEHFGQARVHSVLTLDVQRLEGTLEMVPTMVINVAILVGGVLYLAYLSPFVLLGLGALALPSALIFHLMSKRARASLALHREQHERLQTHLLALSSGIKELKMHQPRRHGFLTDAVLRTTEAMIEHDIEGRSRYLLGQAINQVLVLVLLGALLFAFPLHEEARSTLTSGYVLAGLYLLGPATALAQLAPRLQYAELALLRIEELGADLGAALAEPEAERSERPRVREIELRALVYRYEGDRGFSLGPIDLRVAPGELLFVTGGNGSGKSTLARVLTGLYVPSSGALTWDGEEVTSARRDAYRQLWSAVFSDLHLFDRLYGLDAQSEAQARAWLPRLGLAGVVKVDNGAVAPLELSTGQRKRVGLLIALLEDRRLVLFDEWAADQDPEFRRLFYRELLPALRDQGKGVVVITHDDRYFDVADRVVQLREGRIEGPPTSAAPVGQLVK